MFAFQWWKQPPKRRHFDRPFDEQPALHLTKNPYLNKNAKLRSVLKRANFNRIIEVKDRICLKQNLYEWKERIFLYKSVYFVLGIIILVRQEVSSKMTHSSKISSRWRHARLISRKLQRIYALLQIFAIAANICSFFSPAHASARPACSSIDVIDGATLIN